MRGASLERWTAFVFWLTSGISGISPATLRWTLGPIGRLLPQARQAAEALGPWLRSLLAERQRRGLSCAASAPQVEEVEGSALARLLAADEMVDNPAWLPWRLGAELRRLVWLAEASPAQLAHSGWLAWEVRYWALAGCLLRIAQLHAALARRQGSAQARQALESAAARLWD